MKIISIGKLLQSGYKTNKKLNAIYPIKQKDYNYSLMYDGFLIMINEYSRNADERTKKNAIADLIKDLSHNEAIIHSNADIKF